MEHPLQDLEEHEALKHILEGTARETGREFFRALVKSLATALRTHGAWVTRLDAAAGELDSFALWLDGKWVDEFRYRVKGTPCEEVIRNCRPLHVEKNVVELYTKDPALAPLKAVSYLGVPLLDPEGNAMGNLAVIDHRPMPRDPRALAIIEIFAARAAAELSRLRAEKNTEALREELRAIEGTADILGDAPCLKSMLRDIGEVAPTDATVLIQGETGTGKELVARAIHAGSPRKDRPLVRLNCGAVPGTLIESELFGHEKGAYTGATSRRDGRFLLADRGTLFLDEVGELPVDLQVKLLRVLQEGEFEPVGSSRTRKVDVRVIAATNRDLQKEIEAGRFRRDLFYRLNVFPIHVPPLRERKEDVPVLAEAFAHRVAAKVGRKIGRISAEDCRRLQASDWPGNVRELQNVIERAVITSRGGRLNLDRALPSTPAAAAPSAADGRVRTRREMEELERANVLLALEQAGWKIAGDDGAAALLDLKPSTLSSRMKALGIKRP